MSWLIFDLRDALRSIRRDRAYALTVILTLALTIGAVTAVFSIVNGVLLKPLAYEDSHRLVSLREIWRQVADRLPTIEVNERHFEYWREHATAFESLAQYTLRPANLTGTGDAVQISVARASGLLFDVLKVRASIGRTFSPVDEGQNAADVVTITDSLWRQRFGSDPQVVGRAIVLDGKPYTVVGVLPPGFRLPLGSQLTAAIDAVMPLRISVGWVGDHNNEAIGRLRDGVTIEEARAELDVLQAQVAEIATKEANQAVILAIFVTPLIDRVVSTSRQGLRLLMSAVIAVLLIACSNLANLALTRTLGRQRDIAVRAALGAARRRLIGKLLLEQLLLASAGGAIGVWIAWMALAFFVQTAPVDLPRSNEAALDARVLLFAALTSLLAAALVTFLPAWRIAGGDAQTTLRTTSAAVGTDRSARRSHATLTAVQVALSVMLLIVTGLFAVSFARVLNSDRGFAAEHVIAIDVALPSARYASEPVRQATYDRLLDAVRALPGIEHVSMTSMLPLRGQGQVNFIAREGSTVDVAKLPSANFRFVAPEFFDTLDIAVLRGRPFTDAERDPNRPAPAVVSEPAAARVWPNEDPIGQRFSRGMTTEQGFEVVGVVADAHTTSLDGAQPLMVYVPYWWRSRPSTSLLVKTVIDPSSLLPGVRRVVQEIDPEIAIGQTHPLDALVDASLAGRRYQLQLFAVFGLVALFIASVGVYAVTSHNVSRRRREMNIRIALGARATQVTTLILRQAAIPVVAGLIAGVGGAQGLAGFIASLLFEVRARDPFVLFVVVSVVAAVAIATCGLAAWRGLALDPATALRDE